MGLLRESRLHDQYLMTCDPRPIAGKFILKRLWGTWSKKPLSSRASASSSTLSPARHMAHHSVARLDRIVLRWWHPRPRDLFLPYGTGGILESLKNGIPDVWGKDKHRQGDQNHQHHILHHRLARFVLDTPVQMTTALMRNQHHFFSGIAGKSPLLCERTQIASL